MPEPSPDTPSEPSVRASRQAGLARLLMTFSLTLIGLAFVAIPSLQAPPGAETARQGALAQLRSLIAAQRTWQKEARIDVDGDGVGEFGALSELAGGRTPRLAGEASLPALLPVGFSDEGPSERLRLGSFLFELWLPAKGGGWVGGRELAERHEEIDTDAAERRWCAFAWPAYRVGSSEGQDCFFVDAGGEIYRCADEASEWGGIRRVPHPGCLLSTGCEVAEAMRPPAARLRDGAGRLWVWQH